MPLVSFFRSSKRSNKENHPQSKNVTKVTEASSYIGPSPYSVVTQPKHKGTRSCPGAPISDMPMLPRDQPFSDRHSQLNSSARYVNLPCRRDETFDVSHYRRPPTQPPPRPIREERSYGEHQRYQYESCESDDDDYVNVMRTQVDNLSRENRKLREKCREYRRRMEKAFEDAEYFKRNCERQQVAHQAWRKRFEKEQQKCLVADHKNDCLSRELHLSSQKIMDLEEKVAFFERSLDKYADNSEMDGAGEALCDQNDAFSRELISSDTPSVSMFVDGHIDQEKDEVRMFHTQDSDEEGQDDDMSTPEVEVERSMRASPIELALDTSPPLYHISPGKIGRSLSDTDVQSLASSVAKITVGKTSTLDRTPHYRARMKDVTSRRHDSPSLSSTSEEDETAFQQQQYERQLRKMGEAVKYKPPRKQIEEKYYRRFGKPERAAIDELKFLDDMSSDASGLLSSPDFVVQNPRLLKK